MTETWKPIPGHDGYEASDLGRVRSVDREVVQLSRNGHQYRRMIKGRVLKLCRHRDGHMQTQLGRGFGNRFVHKLVLLAFKGEPQAGHESCHNDSDPANNVLGNLRYGTRSSNLADRRL
jgi:hypothetical protein